MRLYKLTYIYTSKKYALVFTYTYCYNFLKVIDSDVKNY